MHLHTEFSLLDGLSKISKLLERAKQYGQTAISITDHGAMYGAIDFYKKCLKEEVQPIIGCEVYVSADSRLEKKRQDAFHMILLSKDKAGYENLMKIVSIGQTEGFYYKPRIDKEILEKYHEGLIATTGCAQGRVPKLLISEGLDSAEKELKEYEQIFGSDNLYIEIQRHNYEQFSQNTNVPERIREELKAMARDQEIIEKGLLELSKKTGLPIIATNDIHYVDKEDAAAQDALICIQTGKFIADTNRLRLIDTPDFYMKSTEEMESIFSDIPEAITNTAKIAEKVNIEIPIGAWRFPLFEIPEGCTAGEVLKEKAFEGAKSIYGEITQEIKERLDYELDVIDQKGYSTYFLIYSDLVHHCDEVGIYTNTRGSAAGSLTSYCVGITSVDPLRFNLPFERFLNPFRPSLPDIDLDISDDRRDDLISYIKEKYGHDKVAQICTFGTMKARAAARDIGRVMGMPYSSVDRVAKMIPEGSQGFPMTIKKALSITPELKQAYDTEPETKQLLDLSQKVEGNARHISVHAAGVVIGAEELTKFTPIQLETGGGDKVITQYEWHACEDAGLVKLDILGIRNLSILRNAIRIVKKLRKVKINVKKIPLDDALTFEILSKGETFGTFQLGGSGMTKYLMDLKPERVDDIMAMVALYRPGPMGSIPEYIARKHDPKKVKYFDPRMEEYLSASYGILTYQDDVLYTAINLAGYNWGEADKFRKAIGKKIPEEMEAQHERFVTGCVDGGMPKEKAEELFGQIETFAAYGFNKAHASSYGIVAYWTAYVKAHYPVEYLTSLMTAESGNTDKLAEAISECENLGIRVLPPDVNESLTGFTIVDIPQDQWLPTGRARTEGKAIRFGLNAIKNVGMSAIQSILAARESGPFTSLTDLLSRVDSKVNRRVLESLIKSGAMDRFGKRSALLEALPLIKDQVAKLGKNKDTGQTSLFDSGDGGSEMPSIEDKLPDIDEMPLSERLSYEKALLGMYITDHPARNVMRSIRDKLTHQLSEVNGEEMQGKTITVGGVLTSVRLVNTKKNNSRMAFSSLEDDSGSIDLVVFPKLYADTSATWVEDKAVMVTGKVDLRENELSLIVDKVKEVDTNTIPDLSEGWVIRIPHGTDKTTLVRINGLLKDNPGEDIVFIILENGPDTKKIKLPYTVNFTPRLDTEIKQLLN